MVSSSQALSIIPVLFKNKEQHKIKVDRKKQLSQIRVGKKPTNIETIKYRFQNSYAYSRKRNKKKNRENVSAKNRKHFIKNDKAGFYFLYTRN